MAKKKVTIKSELDQLNREAAQEALQQQVVVPVATTDYTGVQGIVGQPSAYDAAYAAEKARIDAAVANGPLFAGQTGPAGVSVQQRAMEQGLYPDMAQAAAGDVAPGVEQSVEHSQMPEDQVGAKVRERAMAKGLFGAGTGDVGEQARERAMRQGLYPDIPQEVPAAGGTEGRPNWDDGLFSPYQKRIGDLEAEQQQVIELDAEMQRREDARKRIVALGDAFASFANLIGTAHGAENQKQTYASPLVADTIDKSRAVRINRMQQIRKNLDDQRDALIAYQIKNDPDYLPNRQAQERIDAQRGNQQLQYYKADLTAANQEANRQRQLDNDAWSHDFKERQQEHKEYVDRAKLGQAAQRIAISNKNYELKAGGGSSKDWSDAALEDYAAFKNEVARNAGCSSWDDFVKEAGGDPNLRTFVNRVNEAKTPNAQRGILNDYAKDNAPEYFNKYHQGSARASKSNTSAPWVTKPSSNTAPWVKR